MRCFRWLLTAFLIMNVLSLQSVVRATPAYAKTVFDIFRCHGQTEELHTGYNFIKAVPVDGHGVSITGTDGKDVIIGTPYDDVIDGRGGDDLICGGMGNDTIFGGDGND